jgi:hypothetical protein
MIAQQKAAREPATSATSRSTASPPAASPSTPSTARQLPIWVANYILADYGTGAIMSVPAHDERDFEFARSMSCPSSASGSRARISTPPTSRTALHRRRRRRPHRLRRVHRRSLPRSAAEDGRLRRAERLRQEDHHLPPQGLGRQPPALLGHAHPDGLLPRRNRSPTASSRCRNPQLPVLLPEQIEITQEGGSPLGKVPASSTPPARSAAAPRVARPTRWTPSSTPAGTSTATRTHTTHRALRLRQGQLLVPHRPVHRRRRARHPAPHLLALLDQGDARSRPDPELRARRRASSRRAWSSKTARRCRSPRATSSRPMR